MRFEIRLLLVIRKVQATLSEMFRARPSTTIINPGGVLCVPSLRLTSHQRSGVKCIQRYYLFTPSISIIASHGLIFKVLISHFLLGILNSFISLSPSLTTTSCTASTTMSPPEVDVQKARSHFPALAKYPHFVFGDNAGGSQILQESIDRVVDYLGRILNINLPTVGLVKG
jgi:hypothetical protein